ncbi:MAG: arsenite efflux transporter metallochaperone ArsD, partial [Oligoflexia bacterium]|nr:arsenite efflux transporter metallochaperone ArsD [Oligoflexia bacterium]
MKKIEIFEPAMCCSTGLCGPSIDSELMRISTLINSLDSQGKNIKRYNLTSAPQEFVSNKIINEILKKEGVDILPVTIVDGVIAKTRTYPSNDEFMQWLDKPIEQSNPKKKT